MPTAIKFENISKQYRLGLVSTRTLSHDLNRWWQINILRREDPYLKIGELNDRAHKGTSEYVWALKDINFEVEQGDVVGIIGKNGAGKSTLLKILSKVTTPTTGSIKAKGRIASLLEVGTGFHPEMTGRENIYMNGAILGMTKADIGSKFDEIVDFAGVERYIDTPVKRYSSGMMVRLGFAVAAFLEPEILVVDEVLAVGDAEFQKKAIGKMQDVSRGDGRTVLFVSHNMWSMSKLCNKGILLQNGCINYRGGIEDTINFYLQGSEIIKSSLYERKVEPKSPLFLQKAILTDETGKLLTHFGTKDTIILKLQLIAIQNIPQANLLVTIVDKNEIRIGSINIVVGDNMEFTVQIQPNFLARGEYYFLTHIYLPGLSPYDVVDNLCPFSVKDSGTQLYHLETFNYGIVFPNMNWI